MHRYRTHKCGDLRESDIGKVVRLSGWCHRIRDHGGVLFIDLRDHYGLTQVVADPDSRAFKLAETLRAEWVVRIDGKVRKRPAGTENPELPTGQVEIYIDEIEVLGPAAELPMPVFGLSTAFSTCAASSFTTTSCCAGESSTRSADG